FSIPFPILILINLLFVGAVYGLLYSLYLAYKNRREFSREFKKFKKSAVVWPYLFLGLIFVAVSFLIKSYIFIIPAALIVLIPYIYSSIKAVERGALIKSISPSELTVGDWLAQEIKVGKIKLVPRWEGLSKEQIALLVRRKKKVLVKYGIPFVPAFLAAVILSLLLVL
ncbi:MAG: hypothetical protein AABX59_04120, partial [Nanoarchaeota archaeon]